jgi:predicted nucleic acid-binding protein
MTLFDTSFLLDILEERRFEEGSISVITLIEILKGIRKEKRAMVKKLLEESFDVIGLDNEVIETYCELYNELKKRGMAMPDADLLIASAALSKKLKLKTKDKDFEKLKTMKPTYGEGIEVL